MSKSIIQPDSIKAELVDNFLNFLKDKKITDMALAFILSTQVTAIVNSFITCISIILFFVSYIFICAREFSICMNIIALFSGKIFITFITNIKYHFII